VGVQSCDLKRSFSRRRRRKNNLKTSSQPHHQIKPKKPPKAKQNKGVKMHECHAMFFEFILKNITTFWIRLPMNM
jgi:hypothetical protein